MLMDLILRDCAMRIDFLSRNCPFKLDYTIRHHNGFKLYFYSGES